MFMNTILIISYYFEAIIDYKLGLWLPHSVVS